MSAPMAGTWAVEVMAVKPFTIHGDLYYELHVARLDDLAPTNPSANPPPGLLALRVPQHATATPPQPGDRLSITFLLGQVTSVTRLSEGAK